MAQRSPETWQLGRDHRKNGWSLSPLQPPQPHAASKVMPQGWDLGARQGTVQVVPVTPPGDSLAQPAEHGEVLGGGGVPCATGTHHPRGCQRPPQAGAVSLQLGSGCLATPSGLGGGVPCPGVSVAPCPPCRVLLLQLLHAPLLNNSVHRSASCCTCFWPRAGHAPASCWDLAVPIPVLGLGPAQTWKVACGEAAHTGPLTAKARCWPGSTGLSRG